MIEILILSKDIFCSLVASFLDWIFFHRVKLPDGLTCSQCVLQWKYRAGNNWGTEDGLSGLGYGIQEEFYNCADIAIGSIEMTSQPTTFKTTLQTVAATTTTIKITNATVPLKTILTTPVPSSISTKEIDLTTAVATITYDYRDLRYIVCEVVEEWKYYEGMLEYCIRICSDRTRECKKHLNK